MLLQRGGYNITLTKNRRTPSLLGRKPLDAAASQCIQLNFVVLQFKMSWIEILFLTAICVNLVSQYFA